RHEHMFASTTDKFHRRAVPGWSRARTPSVTRASLVAQRHPETHETDARWRRDASSGYRRQRAAGGCCESLEDTDKRGMRSRVSAEGLSVHAVAGTNVVLLGLDLPQAETKDLLGFAIQRHDPVEDERYWLRGFKVFEQTASGLTPGRSGS